MIWTRKGSNQNAKQQQQKTSKQAMKEAHSRQMNE